MKKLALFTLVISLVSCYRNVDEIKLHGNEIANAQGMNLVSYQGYSFSFFSGGFVWFTATPKNDSMTIMEYAVEKWNGEYHIYNLSAKNAVKGN